MTYNVSSGTLSLYTTTTTTTWKTTLHLHFVESENDSKPN